MIRMKKYDNNVEQLYLDAVDHVIDIDDQVKIVDSFKKYFPKDVLQDGIEEIDTFKNLILADYETIDKLYKGINNALMQNEVFDKNKKFTELYKILHDGYDELRDNRKIGDEKINVYLVRNSGSYTCPYCNKNYITVRGKDAAGAQLDHFINRKDYPIFAVCLYNLVPSCNVCNLLKGQKFIKVSPFDPALDDSYITFTEKGSLLDNNLEVDLICKDDMEENVGKLFLHDAYKIHKEELKELFELEQAYKESQMCEMVEVINAKKKDDDKKMTEDDIRDMVFGKQMEYEDYGRKPLAKFRHDILKKLHIYM